MRRYVGEGLIRDDRLVGGRCPVCELVMFPRTWLCPRCLDRERPPEEMVLSGEGTLERFAVAERGPREFSPPYVQSYVRLDEGPVVYSLVRGVDQAQPGLQRGQRMRLTVQVVRTDAEGVDVVGWAASPA